MPPPGRLLRAAAIAGLALAAAACGAGSPAAVVAGVGSSTTTLASRAAGGAAPGGAAPAGGALAEFASCMRSHGVRDFPDQSTFATPHGVRTAKGQISRISEREAASPTFQSAQRACSRYAPLSEPPAHVSPQEMRRLLAVARCMRTHGVPSFPDPNPITGEMNPPAGIDRTSPQVLAALRACRPLGEAAGLGPPNTGA
jgi:hypothetical protein